MKYNAQNINVDNGFIFFWKDKPYYPVGPSCLSQWYHSVFEDESGMLYNNAEQYMMAKKALLFGDEQIYEKILTASTPEQYKALGRQVKGYDDKIWNQNKYQIVLTGNYFKFNQNPELLKYLRSTGNKILVEASPYDTIWGIGMDERHPDADYPDGWKGQNLLGFALMETRDKLCKKS